MVLHLAATMNEHNAIVSLVRRCVVLGYDGPWDDLLARLDSTIKKKTPPTRTDEFCDWLAGWLIEGQRFESSLRWLDEKIRSRECISMDDQEKALENYLAQTVESGVGAFFREQWGRQTQANVQRFAEGQDEIIEQRPNRISADDESRIAEIRQYLSELRPEQRVPFWLRYYESLGPLQPEDLEWIGRQCSLSVDSIRERIEAEVKEHQTAEIPISAKFIGQLLGIRPSADGRYLTVDQRISRVRTRLRSRLNPNDEGDEQ